VGSAVSRGDLVRIGSPRLRLIAVVALLAAIALVVGLFVWGPLGRQNSPAQQASTLLNTGLAAQMAGRTSDAADDYRKVLQLDPRNYWAYYNLGVIDHQAGRTDSAERNYRSALVINPDFVPALYNLAIIRSAATPKEAEDLYRHGISIQPTNATLHLNLGFLLIQEGLKAEGQAELDKAVKLDPNLSSRVPPASPTAAPTPKK
jgi:Tfp pilus assembly protein PilF